MATVTTTSRVLPAPAPIFNVFSRMIMAIERRTEQARIRHELSKMSDRDLADLGLRYSDINDVATGSFRRS